MRCVKPKRLFCAALATASLLAGCAGLSVMPVQPGMSQAEVVSRMGTPSRTVPLASGSRMQYSGQPANPSVVMVDLDASGKVTAARQVMALAAFSKIVPGSWNRDDVEREFGPPALVDRVASWQGDIMTYRWLDLDQRMQFWVYLDSANRVQRVGQGMEIPARFNDND